MSSRTILATNLKRFRKTAKVSQEELAARSELSTRSYGKIERGEVDTSLAILDKLSSGTSISVSALLTENYIMEG